MIQNYKVVSNQCLVLKSVTEEKSGSLHPYNALKSLKANCCYHGDDYKVPSQVPSKSDSFEDELS